MKTLSARWAVAPGRPSKAAPPRGAATRATAERGALMVMHHP